jgi:uncharacterized protein (TIGR02284 family)
LLIEAKKQSIPISKEVIFMINDYEATKPITTDATYETTSISNDDVISTLNGLIETCKDGQDGFKEAAEGVERSDLKSLFYEFSQQRAHFAGELQSLVQSLGGDPEKSGSVAGAIHRGWMNIKSAVTGKDEAAILNECERGEDSGKEDVQGRSRERASDTRAGVGPGAVSGDTLGSRSRQGTSRRGEQRTDR